MLRRKLVLLQTHLMSACLQPATPPDDVNLVTQPFAQSGIWAVRSWAAASPATRAIARTGFIVGVRAASLDYVWLEENTEEDAATTSRAMDTQPKIDMGNGGAEGLKRELQGMECLSEGNLKVTPKAKAAYLGN